MATYDITQSTFNVDDIVDGDILECPYTGSETSITLPPGTYRFTVVGATGNFGGNRSTTTQTYTRVGGGGTSVGTIELDDDTTLYINVGGCGSTYTGTSTTRRDGGYNGGGSANAYGGVGGGATHIATASGLLSSLSNNQSSVLIVAGGGGGSNYYSGNSTYYGNGGSGGGTTGAAGTKSGSANTTYCGQGGTQTAGGAAGTNSTRKGTAGSFGQGGNTGTGTSSYASSAGGGGWYGGGAGSNEESGGGGGSGYISSQLTNASTTQGTTTSTYTNGSAQIEVIEISGGAEVYQVNLSLSGGNFIDGHERGTYSMRGGRSDTMQFIPINKNDPVKVFRNDVDVSSSLSSQTISNTITVNSKSSSTYGFTLDSSDNYYKSQNKGQNNSSANCRVNFDVIQQSTLRFTVISYTEEDYDIGVIGKLDTELSTSYETDTVGFWNSMGHNSQSEQTVDMPCPPGHHFVDVKYIKDPATASGNDQFYFKVQIIPLTSDTNFIYTYTLNDIQEDTTLRILVGDVNTNLSVLSSGEHVYLNPAGESSVYKGEGYELQITEEDPDNYYIDKILDNNVDKTSDLVAPHMRPEGTYEVQSYPNASYGFALTDGYYQSQNSSASTAALCKVVFTTSVPSRVTLTYQSNYYSGSSSYNFGMISEVNAGLRTDSAVDTSGIAWNQYDTKTSVTTDTDFSFDIPAGESFVTMKYAIQRASGTRRMLFKVKSIEPLEDLYVPYYTYSLSNVQTAHSIIVVTKAYPKYNVNVDCNEFGVTDKNGTNLVKQGNNLVLTCTPETNYITDTIYVNSVPVSFSGNTYTLTNVQNDTNIYVLFTTGSTRFYQKDSGSWRQVVQAYKKVNGRWEEIQFTAIGDPNAKYIRKN